MYLESNFLIELGDLFHSHLKACLQLNTFHLDQTENMFDCVHPCPCGYFSDTQKPCICAPAVFPKYQKRISGRLLDRIDIHI